MNSIHFVEEIHGLLLADTGNMNHTLTMRLVSVVSFIVGICANFICGFIFRYICRAGRIQNFILSNANTASPPVFNTE